VPRFKICCIVALGLKVRFRLDARSFDPLRLELLTGSILFRSMLYPLNNFKVAGNFVGYFSKEFLRLANLVGFFRTPDNLHGAKAWSVFSLSFSTFLSSRFLSWLGLSRLKSWYDSASCFLFFLLPALASFVLSSVALLVGELVNGLDRAAE